MSVLKKTKPNCGKIRTQKSNNLLGVFYIKIFC